MARSINHLKTRRTVSTSAPSISRVSPRQYFGGACFATVGSVLPHIKSGKLTALAVASRERSALMPQVPTFGEAGVKGFVVDTWYALLAPAGTPADALQTLQREATEFGRSALVRERLMSAGLEPQTVCGDAFATQIAREIDANTRLARELNLKAE